MEDFDFVYDKKPYTLPAYSIQSYPAYIANRMASSLADKIIGQRGVRENYELDKRKLLAEIFMK